MGLDKATQLMCKHLPKLDSFLAATFVRNAPYDILNPIQHYSHATGHVLQAASPHGLKIAQVGTKEPTIEAKKVFNPWHVQRPLEQILPY